MQLIRSVWILPWLAAATLLRAAGGITGNAEQHSSDETGGTGARGQHPSGLGQIQEFIDAIVA